jgi:hypothetical protein
LAAALSLGAATVMPAYALQCLEPVRVDAKRPPDVAVAGMRTFVEKSLRDAGSIFKGHIVSARHVQSIGFDEVFMITYKVSEWKKGSGRAHASFFFTPWCDGICAIQEYIDALVSDHEERIYIIRDRELPDNSEIFAGSVPIDSSTWTCELALSKLPINAERHQRPHFGQFLYDLALAAEIEKLPSSFPKESGGDPAEAP